MNKVLIIVVFLKIVLTQAEDFKCYTCSSMVDSFCSDADDLVTIGSDAIMNCPANNRCFYSRVSSKDTKEEVITRKCVMASYENWCMKVENQNGTATTCVCNTSLCNSATRQYLIKMFTVIVPIAWICNALIGL